jgi:hypothetical protein
MRGFVRIMLGRVLVVLMVAVLLGWQYPGVAGALKPLATASSS